MLVRHLKRVLRAQAIVGVTVRRPRVLRPTSPARLARALVGARFQHVRRRGKYLLFTLQAPRTRRPLLLVGHLGMTGRMYVLPANDELPKHAAVVIALSGAAPPDPSPARVGRKRSGASPSLPPQAAPERRRLVFEDPRYFGRLTFATDAVSRLGPEPLEAGFTPDVLAAALARSSQPVKVKLLDQTVVAGVGNIYASEALFRARISPFTPARRLPADAARRLWKAIREVLRDAIRWGSTVSLDWAGTGRGDRLFYYGRAEGAPDPGRERLRVYDRAGQPCPRCGAPIQRAVQAARSTFYCARCQAKT